MSVAAESLQPPSRLLLSLESRALFELGGFFASLPLLNMAPSGDGHPVLILPGLIASDVSTRPLRGFLRSRGYRAHGWKLGRNFGPRDGVERGMIDRVVELQRRYDRKVSLVGWSLGGVYARQLAKAMPEAVRQVITLGSPFGGSPRATNAWRIYEMTSGSSVDAPPTDFAHSLAAPPPVPTTAIWSRSDGICAWQICREVEASQAENIEVEGSHCGLGHNPAVVYAVADRLAQPEGQWRKFDRGGWKQFVYPNPQR